MLARGAEAADRELPALLSLLVWRDGALASERYFHGATRATAFNVKSVSKSFLSALVGLALREGYLKDLDQPVAAVLPEYFQRPAAPPDLMFSRLVARGDSLRRQVTIRHLLTMTSGLGWDENGLITIAFLTSSNPVRFALELPADTAPGTKYNYNTAGTHILSAVLARKTGMTNRAFGERYLFGPLGITLRGWDVDPQGIHMGGSEMYFTARDLVKFGVLYLNQGAVGGKQLIPADWVERSLAKQVEVPVKSFVEMIPNLDGYGYLWWRRKLDGRAVYCALGYGGQYILIVPELRLVAAGGSALDARNPGTLPQIQGIFRPSTRTSCRQPSHARSASVAGTS